MHWSEDAETAQKDETAQGHLQLHQRLGEMACALGVGTYKILLVQTLGDTGCMHHVVEAQGRQLTLELFLVV